jgi:hypothetical protein
MINNYACSCNMLVKETLDLQFYYLAFRHYVTGILDCNDNQSIDNVWGSEGISSTILDFGNRWR